MAKSEIYFKKIEKSRTVAVTGFRFKQAVYNAVVCCHKEGRDFPYREILERFCLPQSHDYLVDESYYILKENEMVLAERTQSEGEQFLREMAGRTGGKIAFTVDRQPVLLLDNWELRAARVDSKNKIYAEEFTEDFSVPYALYPRIVDIVNGKALVEIEKRVCEWQSLSDAGID